jgi:hypothetical protein
MWNGQLTWFYIPKKEYVPTLFIPFPAIPGFALWLKGIPGMPSRGMKKGTCPKTWCPYPVLRLVVRLARGAPS